MAELFGRVDGCAHGRGGSMHLLDVERRLLRRLGHRRRPAADRHRPRRSGWSARAAPQAVLCELGDGAINMGAWHESLNLAAVWRLPVVFLVMNNEYGMGTSVERASAVHRPLPPRRAPTGCRRSASTAMTCSRSHRLRRRCSARRREERQAGVLELVTYRYRGHSVADAGLAYRTRGEIDEHVRHDPIFRVRELLAGEGRRRRRARRDARSGAEARVAAAVEAALASPPPPVSKLATGMYAPGSAAQFARMLPGAPFGERELVFAGGLGRVSATQPATRAGDAGARR